MENLSEKKKSKLGFWRWAIASVILRLVLIYFPWNLNLDARPEVSTPLNSIRRLAEGHWLKLSSLSPYSGSMYHGSPLLLSVFGPLTVVRIEGQPKHILCSLLFVIADIVSAMLIRAIGQTIRMANLQSLQSLGLKKPSANSGSFSTGDIGSLAYLWNPFAISACVGLSTSPVENLFVVLSIYGACTKLVPLAAFGWVMATHVSLYPTILIIPVVLLLGYGPDAPPRKLVQKVRYCTLDNSTRGSCLHEEVINESSPHFSWRPVLYFSFWASLWSLYVIVLCYISVKQYGGLWEMFKSTCVFILTVEDLSPNIGILWYFFAEVFDFFRSFFLIMFHINILIMLLPLAIRLNHRPCFLAFLYVTILSMVKSYPSVGDSALYLGLLGLFFDKISDMRSSFFLFSGYVAVSLLSPVMHNLWIFRGTGNANFYFATTMAYACLQIILVVESVSAMLNHDGMLKKLSSKND